jgi:hypothetical protein
VAAIEPQQLSLQHTRKASAVVSVRPSTKRDAMSVRERIAWFSLLDLSIVMVL